MAKKTREKVMAQELYVNTAKTQKEIAEAVGVTENTLSKWANQGNWETLKSAKSITRQELLARAYRQLDKINDAIDEAGGIPSKKVNDAKSTIIREIAALDKEESISITVSVLEKLLTFVAGRDPGLAKKLAPLQLEFLERRSNEG